MKTLYDLLGALADDDSEDVRTAFRKAVKGTHPDLNPDDPDAALKFRQIVRANEILSDEDQRAVYDHLLDLAEFEQQTASKYAFAAVLHKIASGTMAAVGAGALTIGGYLLFIHISVASVVSPDRAEIVRRSAGMTAAAAAADVQDAGSKPVAVAATSVELAHNVITPRRAGEISADRDDAARDEAIEPDQPEPKFAVAYIDRKIIFYRPRRSEHPFADIVSARHIEAARHVEKPNRHKPAPTIAKMRRPEPPMPIPRRRTAERDPSREGAFPFMP